MKLPKPIPKRLFVRTDRNRILLLAVILVVICISIIGVTTALLYENRIKVERLRMQGTVQSQARMIESVADYIQDQVQKFPENHPEGTAHETMDVIQNALSAIVGFGRTGEFTIASRQGEEMHFLWKNSNEGLLLPENIPFESGLAEPMRLALSGQSGTLIGLDYRGQEVLSAYEPLSIRNMGLVAKIDLQEVREPFVRTSLIATIIAIALIGLGIFLFYRLANPLIDHLEKSLRELETEIGIRQAAETRLREYSDQLEERVAQRTLELETKVLEAGELNKGIMELAENLTATNTSLELSTKKLATSNQELEAFSYSVSHDLRAPLRAIDGFSQILVEDYRHLLDEEGQRLLKVITDNAKKMGTLIDGILAFSRLGKTALIKQKIDLPNLIDSLIAELEPMTHGRKIEWHISPLPQVEGDRVLIHQVFQNLLTNALKFTGTRDKAILEIGMEVQDHEEVIYVRDNGVGFDMQYVDKIFQVFQRLHTEDEFSGNGIGLAFVKRILDRHDSRIWAYSEQGKGTTMYISFSHQGGTNAKERHPDTIGGRQPQRC